MSASLPKGTIKTAETRRYYMATQLIRTASAANSLPMAGSATLMAEPTKGLMKAVDIAMIRTAFFSESDA